MAHLIDKSAVVAEIERRKKAIIDDNGNLGFKDCQKAFNEIDELKKFINTLEVKDVDLIINTIIAECCDWLAMTTNLSHDEIEGCRNLMLTVKEEQLKHRKEKRYDNSKRKEISSTCRCKVW